MFNLFKRQKASTTVALSTAAALVLSPDNNRGRAIIRNTHGSIAVYVGNSDVSSSNGFKLAAGESISLRTRGKVYAVAASSTPSVQIITETIRGNDIKTMVVKSVTPSDVQTAILNRDSNRTRAIIQNLSSSNITIGNSSITAGAGGIELAQNKTIDLLGTEAIYAIGPGTNETQTITVTGTPAGGTYKLSFRGEESGAIAFNAVASGIQTALRAMAVFGTDVAVTGTTPITATFTGALANTDLPMMTLSTNALTGGTAPSVTIAEGTKGASATYASLTIVTEKI